MSLKPANRNVIDRFRNMNFKLWEESVTDGGDYRTHILKR